ncbi:MAG TPA: hybrid sensor histidine kinase/response regulator, partial [Legionella sp.]|nr:hybrid sensor histidine kinase/response regulator [Legionella sp.]
TLEHIKTRFYRPPALKQTPGMQAGGKLGFDLPNTEQELFQLHAFDVLNTESALLSMGDDMDLLKTILTAMIRQEMPNDIMALDRAYAAKEWGEIEKLAHRMKGGLVYCGTVKLVQACQYLERYHKAGHTRLLEALYEQLRLVADETTVAIQDWLTR